MRFKLLLWALGWVLKHNAKSNPEFKEYLGQKSLIFQVYTQDGTVARHFIFAQQQVRSGSGRHPDSQIGIRFESAKAAYKILTSKAPQAFAQHVQAGDIRFEGDMQHLQWLQGLLKYMRI